MIPVRNTLSSLRDILKEKHGGLTDSFVTSTEAQHQQNQRARGGLQNVICEVTATFNFELRPTNCN